MITKQKERKKGRKKKGRQKGGRKGGRKEGKKTSWFQDILDPPCVFRPGIYS